MRRDIRLTLLERARVAAPCSAKWEEMRGDEKTRFCEQCSLHVHNLTAMSAAEAEMLLAKHFGPDGTPLGERFCGRLFRRADGTVLERDCPVGLARVRIAARAGLARIAAAIGLLTGLGAALAWTQRTNEQAMWGGRLRGLEPLATLSRWMAPRSLPPTPGRQIPPVAGAVCITPIPAPNPPAPAPQRAQGGM